MAKWTDKYKIMEDLSVAQGRIVPASFKATFGDNGPPGICLTEETEEEYYKDCIGDGDFTSGPDIGLIQEMLSMVRDHNISSDEDPDKVVVISKLNPTSPDFVPNIQMGLKPEPPASKLKKKRNRNVALSSLLNNIDDQIDPVIDTPKENINDLNIKKSPVIGCHMFKRKQTERNKKTVSQPIVSNVLYQQRYTPSALAKDYYDKYLENSKKKVIQEDIWTKVERELKIIEDRKKREALVSTSPSTSSQGSCEDATTSSSTEDSAHAFDKVCLPQQRHLLKAGEDCVVCEVFKKNVYDIKDTLKINSCENVNSA